VTEKSKQERKQIHEAIKKIYKHEFTANTKEVEDRKVISVIFQKGSLYYSATESNSIAKMTIYQNTKFCHLEKKCSLFIKKCFFIPDERRGFFTKVNRYIHFTMYKENMDTMDAVNVLAQKLGYIINNCIALNED
jgi:tRNA(Glu) U13 pseudouridine synthase TruD